MHATKKRKRGGEKHTELTHIWASCHCQFKISLWVKEGGQLHANCMLCAETVGGTWVGDAPGAITVVKTLQWRRCFAFWPGKGGGMQG